MPISHLSDVLVDLAKIYFLILSSFDDGPDPLEL